MNRVLISSLKSAFDHLHVGNTAFRLVARCDAFPLFEATRHADFNRFLLWAAPVDEKGTAIQVDKLIRECTLNKAAILSLCDRITGTWIGLVRLEPYGDGFEMGLSLHPMAWAKGVVASAGRAVIETLLAHVGDLPVYVRVRPGNVRMEKICAFYHFEAIDQVTDTHARDGLVNLHLFRLRKDLWTPYTGLFSY